MKISINNQNKGHRVRMIYKNLRKKTAETIFPFFVLLMMLSVGTNAQNEATIYNDSTEQVIRGFGAANILPWRPDMTSDEIQTAFGTGEGELGFSILRLRVPNQEGEFSVNVSTAKAAYDMGVTIIASPWSPPASMKTNNNTTGGSLKENNYQDYADHLKSFADYMEDNGVPLYAISVQNEPDIQVGYESCDWTPQEMTSFMKNNAASIGVDIIAPESFQFRRPISDAILNDPAAETNLSIVGGHIYGGGLAPYPLAVQKGKEVWMTEYLINGDMNGQDMDTSWAAAMLTARSISDCMDANMSAYIWWYIVRYYGPISDGTLVGKGQITKKGYVMSNFARFIRPGYYKINYDYIPQRNVFTTAYKNSTSSKMIIVAINNNSSAKEQTFILEDGTATQFSSYVTSKTKNCLQESDIEVVDDSFTVTLDAKSITTFISDSIITTSVGHNTEVPENYILYQNYPNPFNPTTQIEYAIPENEFVSLRVYNLLGEEVITLFEGIKSAGTYKVTFNGDGLANGIYMYQLKAGNYIKTKKLMLLK